MYQPSDVHPGTHAGDVPLVSSEHQIPTVRLNDEIISSDEDQWSQPQRVESGTVSFHHDDPHSEHVPASVSATHAQTEQSWQHNRAEHYHHPSEHGTESAPAVPILSAVPQYVRGEEHVSTYIPPLPHIPASVFAPPARNSNRQPEALVEQHHKHQPAHHQPTTSEPHIYQPQPVGPTSPIAQLYQRPPSPEPEPEPEPPTFEAPRAEWDGARYVPFEC